MNYKDLQKLAIDTEALSLMRGDGRSDYFCTPRGATVIGRAGVDGIHFCTVKKFGEMIFSVSPMNGQNDYVHPVARNFEDFLRLLLALGDTNAIEQTHFWTRERFDTFRSENPISEQARAVLAIIADTFGLSPMEDPYGYITELQKGFDYFSIPYKSDYAEWCPLPKKRPAWKVTYGGEVRGGDKPRRAGKELFIGKEFSWGEETWLIPAGYLCGEGLVLDLCVMIEPEALADYFAKWEFLSMRPLTPEMQETSEEEHPMHLAFHAIATVNGKPLREESGTGLCWYPDSCRPEGTKNDDEALWHLEHYGLDASKAWVFRRLSFPWATVKKPTVKKLSLTIAFEKARITAGHFTVGKAGGHFSFRHPVSGISHELSVVSYEKNELPISMRDETCEYPRYFHMMTYALTPALSCAEHTVCDCEESDQPRYKKTVDTRCLPDVRGDCAILVIGGSDGPTAVLAASRTQAEETVTGAVASSLHFEERAQTEFRFVFRVKTREDMQMLLYEKEETI